MAFETTANRSAQTCWDGAGDGGHGHLWGAPLPPEPQTANEEQRPQRNGAGKHRGTNLRGANGGAGGRGASIMCVRVHVYVCAWVFGILTHGRT